MKRSLYSAFHDNDMTAWTLTGVEYLLTQNAPAEMFLPFFISNRATKAASRDMLEIHTSLPVFSQHMRSRIR